MNRNYILLGAFAATMLWGCENKRPVQETEKIPSAANLPADTTAVKDTVQTATIAERIKQYAPVRLTADLSGLSDTGVWMVAFIFVLLLPAIGVLAAPAFLFACDSISLMEFQNRKKMLNATVIYPWLFGSIFLALLKFPDLQNYETLQLFTFILILLPVYLLNQNNLFSETIPKPQKTRLAQLALVFLILIAFTFRVVLHNGMRFG